MAENQTMTTPGAGKRFLRAHHILVYFLSATVTIWLLSGFYQVQPNQVAIVERLGQYVSETKEGKATQMLPGLHWHLPWPIDRVHVVSVQQQLPMIVKAFNVSPADYDDFKRTYMQDPSNPFAGNPVAMNAIFNPYLIAADKSVVHMELNVQFAVRDPELWLQAISHEYHTTYDPDAKGDLRNTLLQQIMQRAMIAQASRVTFEDLLKEKRDSLRQSMQTMVSEGLVIHTTDRVDPKQPEHIDLGIKVLAVQVTEVRAPDAIRSVYDNVMAQRSARETAITVAKANVESLLTKVEGEKKTLKLDADTYQTTTEQAARGEAQRFEQVLAQYMNTPDVTRWNIWVDAATTVTGNAKRIFYARPGQKTYIKIDPVVFDAKQVAPSK
jgi:modulator of FtsH protease HflK